MNNNKTKVTTPLSQERLRGGSVVFLFSILIALMSCGSRTSRVEHSDDDSTAVRIALLPTVESLPLYVAADEGIFDSLGLHVRLLNYDAAMNADTAFQRGHADVLVTDLVKATLWRSQGQAVSTILSANLNLYLVTARSARLKTAQSLKEKIIAYTRNSATDYTADGMLALARLRSEQLNKPQINSLPLRTQMLINAQYDGALLPEPYASAALAEAGNLVLSTENLRAVYNPLLCILVHDTLLTADKARLEHLKTAYDIAVDRIEHKDSLAVATLIRRLPTGIELPDSMPINLQLTKSTQPKAQTLDSIKSWLRLRQLIDAHD